MSGGIKGGHRLATMHPCGA